MPRKPAFFRAWSIGLIVQTKSNKVNLMNELSQQLAKAERLHAVTQQVGFGLWQLQELEGAAAQYYVLVALAIRGMGVEAGNALVENAQSKTFGSTITKLVKAKHLPGDVEPRFQALLKERNWLVHSSRSTSRDAIHNDAACSRLSQRLEAIAEEARLLLKIIGKAAEEHVKRHGISSKEIDEITAQTLKTWHSGNAA
jgi:hypothetical protein